MSTTEGELVAELESWRDAMAQRNAELAEAEAEIERVKSARLPFDPAILSTVDKSPEDIARLVALCMVGEHARFDDLDEARAFAAKLDELSCERLVQACAERGRPEGVRARLQRATRETSADGSALKALLALVLEDLAPSHALYYRIAAALKG